MILDIENLHAHYGKSHVLQGVSLQVGDGELVTLLGRNGAGKTTTLKSICGVVPPTQGRIRFSGQDVQGLAPHTVAQRGVCLVPEHRGVFKLLTVEENLLLGQRKHSPWQLDDIYRIFPRLKERRGNGGGQLSGGEQQMLAIGRALMTDCSVILLDEPSMGLSPLLMYDMFRTFKKLNSQGLTVVVVEQNARLALQVADRGYVLDTGAIVAQGTAAELADTPEIKAAYLGA